MLESTRENAEDGNGAEVHEEDILRANHFLVYFSADRLDESVGNESTFRHGVLVA